MINLKGRSFLTLKDYTSEEITYLIDLSAKLKADKKRGVYGKNLENKNIALIFEKLSTRTRCAFTVACFDEGAHPEFLGKNDIHLGVKESLEDTARVLGRMFDGIQYRGFDQTVVETLAKHSGVPVWNGLTDIDHPTQVLADLLTIKENFGKLKGINLSFFGDGRNNVAMALMIGCSKLGLNYTVVAPEELQPDSELVRKCSEYAKLSGGSVKITENVMKGATDADVIYTDVWASMGEEDKSAERIKLLTPFRVTKEVMSVAKDSSIFMHDLPAVKGNEVTEEVFESSQSVVFDEAENRMHTIKAVMVATIIGA